MLDLALCIGAVALAISLYAASSAGRSAAAAERSARLAEEAVSLERQHAREAWIGRLAEALPDGKLVNSLLADLPESLRPEWMQLLTSAARRNPRTPERRFRELLEEHSAEWSQAASPSRLPARGA